MIEDVEKFADDVATTIRFYREKLQAAEAESAGLKEALKVWRDIHACDCAFNGGSWVQCDNHVALENALGMNTGQAALKVIEAAKEFMGTESEDYDPEASYLKFERAMKEWDAATGGGDGK